MATAQEVLDHAQKIEKNQPLEALNIYRQVLAMAPQHYELLLKVGGLAARVFEKEEAIAVYSQALAVSPGERAPSIALAFLLSETDPSRALQIIDAIKTSNPSHRFEIAAVRLRIEEWSYRAGAGLPVHHLTDMADFPFRFTDAGQLSAISSEWTKAEPNNPKALIAQANALGCIKQYDEANRIMARVRELAPEQPRSWITFGELPETHNVALPPLETIIPLEAREAIVIACDDFYFGLVGYQLIRSLRAHSAVPIHIHIMASCDDPRLDAVALLKGGTLLKDLTGISITREQPQRFIKERGITPESYYGAMRFVRFAELIEKTGASLWLMDADALANRDPSPMMAAKPQDLGARVRAGRMEPWHQFSACLVKGSMNTLDYFQTVSQIILSNIDRLWWGLDQYALFSAYIAHKPAEIALMGPGDADIGDYTTSSTFWYVAGDSRMYLIRQLPIPRNALNLARYVEKFRSLS